MTRIVNVILVLSLVSVLGSIGVSSGGQATPQKPSRAAVARAIGEGGMRAAAAVSGGEYIGNYHWIPEVPYSLEGLAAMSDVVLIGTLGKNLAHLSASGEYIMTNYHMTVQRSVKGGMLPNSTVVFGVMGGKVVFDDGSSAAIETKGFIRPNTGAQVVIFAELVPDDDPHIAPAVRAYSNGAPVVRLVGMGRSIFELPSNQDDRIRMNAIGASDVMARRWRGQTRGQFIAEVERAVRQPGGPNK